MWKYFLGLLVATSVQAQTTIPTVPPKEALPGMATVDPVSLPYIVEKPLGIHYFVVTKDALGLYGTWGFHCTKGVSCLTDSQFWTEYSAAIKAPDKVSAIRGLYNKYITYDCNKDIRAENTARGALCRESKEAKCEVLLANYNVRCLADNETPPPPPAPTYVVTSANAYEVINGSRSLLSTAKATLGATCDCSVKFTSLFGSTFCKVTIPTIVDKTMVAGCSLKK